LTAKPIAGHGAKGERRELRPGRSSCRRRPRPGSGPETGTSPGSSACPAPQADGQAGERRGRTARHCAAVNGCLNVRLPTRHHAERQGGQGERARTRRYLKPEFGCLRRNRREVFAAALTRYLKPVYAAEPVGIGGLPSSADTRNLTTESDEGTGGRAAGSGAISAEYLYLQSQDPRSPSASRPGAQGRLRPEHRKRRGSSAVPAHGNRYGEQRSWCLYMRSAVSAGRSRGDMSTPQKCPSTRRYLQTTSDSRRYVRTSAQCRSPRWPSGFGRSVRP
jgi:hypothetical protein